MASAPGRQQAPADIPLTWESNHFVRGADGTTYVPFTLAVDRSKLAAPGVAMYVRVGEQGRRAGARAARPNNNDRNRNQKPNQRVTYPWDNVHFLDVPADGKIQRAFAREARRLRDLHRDQGAHARKAAAQRAAARRSACSAATSRFPTSTSPSCRRAA